MKRSTILCSLLLVLLVLSLCACSASPSGASDGAETPNNIFHELTLPAVTEGQVSVLDARGSRILYVREEKLLSKDGGYAYYETKQVGIYDVDAQKSLAVWEPETPGNYFGGALLDGDAAILALQLDYTNAHPAQFAAMYFGGSQRSLVELTGELQWLLPFSGREALASYRTDGGAFGVYRLSADGCTDALLLQADANTEPMGGDLAVCGDRFCYAYAKNGQVTLCTVSADGTQDALALPESARLDSFWLTADGPLICQYVEQNGKAQRLLTRYASGETHEVTRPAADGALYQLRFANGCGFAVNGSWGLQLLQLSEDGTVSCRGVTGLPDELSSVQVRILSSGDGSFCLFYPEAQRLFRAVPTS